jgi:hypothetical protein
MNFVCFFLTKIQKPAALFHLKLLYGKPLKTTEWKKWAGINIIKKGGEI